MIKFIAFTVFVFLYFLIDWVLKQRRKKRLHPIPDIVRNTFIKVEVPVSKVEILSNQYQQEIIDNIPSKIEMVDALYDNGRNVKMETKSALVLVTHFMVRGKKVRWNSETIDWSYNDLANKLYCQKNITIYYKNGEPNNYYFELDFLK